jgi:hypothetical protein
MTQHMPHQSFQMVLPFKHAALSFLGEKIARIIPPRYRLQVTLLI